MRRRTPDCIKERIVASSRHTVRSQPAHGVPLQTCFHNWTRGAAANSENLNLVSSPTVAAAYAARIGTTASPPLSGSIGERTGAGLRARRYNSLAAEAPMLDTALRRFFWRIVDGLDYVLTLVRLRILDAVAGPEPETPADQKREKDREQIEREFPNIATPED